MDIGLFLGRFHPVVVHLPIGFLVLAGLMEWFSRRSDSPQLNSAVSFSLFWGAVSGVIAVVLGFLLASDGGYDEQALNLHRFLGIVMTVLAVLAWLAKSDRWKASPRAFSSLLVGMILLVFATGHFGGVLTHGSSYLFQYAPGFVQAIFMESEKEDEIQLPAIPDSLVVYQHLIDPILQSKCVQCHNNDKQSGGLNLVDAGALAEGGEDGEVVHGGDPFGSEIFARLVLPQTSKKFMPPKGTPLTYGQVRLMQWWIDQGASFDTRLTDLEVPEEVKTILLNDYQYDMKPRSYVEIAKIDPLPEEALADLRAAGLKVRMLASQNFFLEVEPVRDTIGQQEIEALLLAKENIAWLNLGESGVTDQMLSTISQLPNLTRLRLQKNSITDEGLSQLKDLDHLESLNLYGTQVTDNSLEVLKTFPALRRLYLWQTGVTSEGAEELRSARRGLDVNMGYEAQPPAGT